MSDLLTESVLPTLGLCPPSGLLLPWLEHARGPDGRTLSLASRASAATFAVAKRVASRRRPTSPSQAPVAAVFLEETEAEAQAEGPRAAGPARERSGTLVMLDWHGELAPHSGQALRQAEPKRIFGMEVRLTRRCLLMLTEDHTAPLALLRETAARLGLAGGELGWLGLRSLYEIANERLRRLPRERWRAPERAMHELAQRLARVGFRQFRPLPPPPEAAPLRRRFRYLPLRPGSQDFPWRFAVPEPALNEALVLQAQLLLRKEQRRVAAATVVGVPAAGAQ